MSDTVTLLTSDAEKVRDALMDAATVYRESCRCGKCYPCTTGKRKLTEAVEVMQKNIG